MKLFLHLSCLLVFFTVNASAAPAMRSHVCEITAVVQKIEERKESYGKPESWRKAWGLPKFQKYTDVTLSIVSASLLEEYSMGECTPQKLPEIFQLRGDVKSSKIPVGTCLKGKTQFSGDEFLIGHWLYDVETLSESDCHQFK